jgi:uncharacterized protein (TIGR03437 family)
VKYALLFLVVAVRQLSAQSIAPDYTQSSLVHAATNRSGTLAPNTIATLYGVNLATSTRALQATDIRSGAMPITLPGTGTVVLLGGINVPIYYASPTQVNFLVPMEIAPGNTRLTVVVDGLSGRTMPVAIQTVAPGLFMAGATSPAAVDLAGRLITAANPATPGQWVILYATGLGGTIPQALSGEIAVSAARLASRLTVWLGGVAVDPAYAGLAPGYAGLYQINFIVPAQAPANPEVRLETNGATSPSGVFLPIKKPD